MQKPVRINFESLRPHERTRLIASAEPTTQTSSFEGVWYAYPWSWNGRPVEVWRFVEHAHHAGQEPADVLAA